VRERRDEEGENKGRREQRGGGTLPAAGTHTHMAHRQGRGTTHLEPADTDHLIRIFKPAMVFFFAPEEAFIKNFGLSNARNTATSSPSTLTTI
jgi:hypothetical protein